MCSRYDDPSQNDEFHDRDDCEECKDLEAIVDAAIYILGAHLSFDDIKEVD